MTIIRRICIDVLQELEHQLYVHVGVYVYTFVCISFVSLFLKYLHSRFLSTSTHKNRRTPSLRYFSVNRTPLAVWTGASYLVWLSSPKIVFSAQAASLIHRRCLAGGGGNMSFLSFFRRCLLAEENKPGKENKSRTLFSLYKKS